MLTFSVNPKEQNGSESAMLQQDTQQYVIVRQKETGEQIQLASKGWGKGFSSLFHHFCRIFVNGSPLYVALKK